MSRHSSRSPSPSKRRRVDTPSLVILSDGELITPFMRRRYNPFEPLPALPSHFILPDGTHPPVPPPRPSDFIPLSIPSEFPDIGPLSAPPPPRPPPPPRNNPFQDFHSADSESGSTRGLFEDDSGCHAFGEGNSQATTVVSTFVDDETLNENVRRQLDFLSLGLNFPSLFDGLPHDERRRIARIARLQIVQKKQWLHKVWSQFDPTVSQESLLETLNTLNADDGSGMNGLFGSAKEVARKFLWVDCSGIFPGIRCLIHGPRFSGKTTFLRTLILEFLVIFANTGVFKSVFIVALDFKKADLSSIDSLYGFMTNSVVTALLGQRPDVELFAHSLSIGFSGLLKAARVRRLPKPLSSQDYLRRPMRMIDEVLAELHRLYGEQNERKQFLERVVALPRTISEIFGFPATLLVVDHLDLLPRALEGLDVLKVMIGEIGRTQSIVSAEECGLIVPLRNDWNIVSVTDTCTPEYSDRKLIVSFKKRDIPDVIIDEKSCGGCPTFVTRFDDICRLIIKREGIADEIKKEESMIKAVMLIEILLDLLMSFGEFEEDGGPPLVQQVALRTVEPPEPVDEYSDE